MITPAFSTVACPEWTLPMVAERAIDLGFECVELRTFGDASREFACDPALTAEAKVRQMFFQRGLEIASLGTSIRFDEPIFPPMIGLFMADREKSVREGKRAIELAVGLECPLVRVFGFEYPAKEKPHQAIARVASRLAMVMDHADKSGVRVVIENGGSFSTCDQVIELLNRVKHPLLGVCYNIGVGAMAGEDPAKAVSKLGSRLWAARVMDRKDGKACRLGDGDLHVSQFVGALTASGFSGPVIYELDRAWSKDPQAEPLEAMLRAASKALFDWIGKGRTAMKAQAAAVTH